MKHSYILLAALSPLLLASCKTTKLETYSVAYQSVRTRYAQPTPQSPIPDEAKIAVAYSISADGELTAIVYNRTSEIVTIDQTMSFFVNSDGKSTSYYDPTVRTTSTTDLKEKTKGGSVNLGAIAGAFGIGGIIGDIASGVNLGGSGTSGTSVTNATYIADQPRVSLAPHSNGAMSKVYKINGIGGKDMKYDKMVAPHLGKIESYCKFSVCITYSFDGGATFDKLVTNFYADSKVIIPVTNHGSVNNALQTLYQTKTDCLNEPWYLIHFNYSIKEGTSSYSNGIIYDYQ